MSEHEATAARAISNLRKANDEFTQMLLDIMKPPLVELPNPYDEDLFLDGDDDGSGPAPHQR